MNGEQQRQGEYDDLRANYLACETLKLVLALAGGTSAVACVWLGLSPEFSVLVLVATIAISFIVSRVITPYVVDREWELRRSALNEPTKIHN